MAIQDYQVTPAGEKKLLHDGVVIHAGRLVPLESTTATTIAALARGIITSSLTSSIHDVNTGHLPGVKSAEPLTTYHVTASGASRILHGTSNPPPTTALANGAAIALDALDDQAVFLLGKGWIS